MPIDRAFGDPDVHEDGRWFPVKNDEADLKIRSFACEGWQRFMRRNRDILLSGTQDGSNFLETGDLASESDIDQDEAEQAMLEGLAEHILVDWRNLTFADEEAAREFGVEPYEDVPYSSENAVRLMEMIRDPVDLRQVVIQTASDYQHFRAEREEQDTGNSPAASNGS